MPHIHVSVLSCTGGSEKQGIKQKIKGVLIAVFASAGNVLGMVPLWSVTLVNIEPQTFSHRVSTTFNVQSTETMRIYTEGKAFNI